MASRYNAFISYRHAPLDIQVARSIHRGLEHFHIPAAIRKRSGVKKINRIFRDKEELPITSNLNEDIADALANSDYLIVICSPRTNESMWVQKEIETFLQTHDHSRVLTVLAEGEPEDVIPEILLSKTVVDSDSGQERTVPVEPLSCDYRVSHGKALREELPRLAAALLGCQYDELRQRQKIYRQRRAAAIMAGCLALTALAAKNRADLLAAQAAREAEYEKARLNEALFVAEQSGRSLDEGDPLGAIQQILDFLPPEEQGCPIPPEMEYVLGQALGLYRTPGAAEDVATAVGRFDMGDSKSNLGNMEMDCSEMALDDTGKYLLAWDTSRSSIQVWNTENLSMIRELCPPGGGTDLSDNLGVKVLLEQLMLTMDGAVMSDIQGIVNETVYGSSGVMTDQTLVKSENQSITALINGQVYSFNYATGQINWTWATEKTLSLWASLDQTKVVVISGDRGEYLETSSGPHALAVDILDMDTGEHVKHIPFQIEADHSLNDQLCVSPDLKWAALTAEGKERPGDGVFCYDTVYLLNLDTGTCERLPDSETAVLAMCFFDNSLTVMRCDDYTLSARARNGNNYKRRNSIACLIEAYETTTRERLWVCEQEYTRPVQIARMECVPFENETGSAMLAVFSDRSVLLDPKTGSVICKYDLYDAAADIRLGPTGFETVNVDGSCTQVYYDLEWSLNFQYFQNPVLDVCWGEDVFYIQQQQDAGLDNSIYKYELSQYDTAYRQHFETETTGWELYDIFCTEEGSKALLAQENQICLVDVFSAEARSYPIPAEYSFSNSQILSGPTDGTGVYWENGDECFNMIDLESGDIQQFHLPQLPGDSTVELGRIFCGEKLLVLAQEWESRPEEGAKQSDPLVIYFWDLREADFTEVGRMTLPPLEDPLMSFGMLIRSSLVTDAEENQLYFALRPYDGAFPSSLVQVDLESETITEVPLSFEPASEPVELVPWKAHCGRWNSGGTQGVFVFEDMLYSVNADGQLQYTIPVEGTAAYVQLSPDQESFFLFTEETLVARYRLSDGLYLGGIELKSWSDDAGRLYSIGLYAGKLKWEFLDNDTMAVYTGSEGYLLDISGGTINMKAIVCGYCGYDPIENRFVVSESSGTDRIAIGSFPYFTQEDMLHSAGKILGD